MLVIHLPINIGLIPKNAIPIDISTIQKLTIFNRIRKTKKTTKIRNGITEL